MSQNPYFYYYSQQHAKSQISPTVRPRASNEGAFDRLASWSTQLKHRMVALASLSLWYVTLARRRDFLTAWMDFSLPRTAFFLLARYSVLSVNRRRPIDVEFE